MAAGRNGAYRSAAFSDRESSRDIARKDVAYPEDNNGQISDSIRVLDRDRGVRGSRGRLRKKDIKGREVVNGTDHSSSSSGSDSGRTTGCGAGGCGYSMRLQDREPGELSSESGSDGAVGSEPPVKDADVPKFENGTPSPLLTKKRKFSPIVWDMDDKEVKDFQKGRAVLTTASARRPTPPLPEREFQATNAVPKEDPQISPVKSNKPNEPGTSPQWGKDEVTEQHEDEDYIPARNISSSRWAGYAESPSDEGEISDDDLSRRMRKVLSSDFQETKLDKRSTPEFIEFKREGYVGPKARSEDPEDVLRTRPSSVDRGLENVLDKEDHMEVDSGHNSDQNSLRGSDMNSDGENDRCETPEPPGPPVRTANMLLSCRSVDEFERLNRIDEGTYGVVYRAKDNRTGEILALKKVKMEKEREGFPLTSLREINILLSLHHPSIIDVKVVVGSDLDSIFMVMEYMEHDLKGLMETMKQPFSQSEVKCLMLQLLEGVTYLHDNWVLHRDLKTSNLLLNNRGELKVCDFGLARQYGSPLKPYTHLVVTLWYRAPELLLGAEQYSTAIDMWSLGCIMAELLSKEPLFNGKTEFDQLDKIFRILGTPNETIWPGFSKLPGVKINFVKHQYNLLRKKFPATSFTGSPVLSDAGFNLLNKLLTYDPDKRITADAALKHEWFKEVPLPKSKEFMPTFPAQHTQDRRTQRVMKSPDPLEEQRKELQQAEFGAQGLLG